MLADKFLKRTTVVKMPVANKSLRIRTSLKAGEDGICWDKIDGQCITICCPTANGPACRTVCYNPSIN